MPEQHHHKAKDSNTSASDEAHNGAPCNAIEDPASHLPFVGRETDLAQITSFARISTMINRLHLLWMQGEGGIGKSRLLAEAAKHIDPKIVLLYIRFLPDTTLSLVESFDIAIREAHSATPSHASPASDSLSNVLASLRDLVRLQPTLLALDNLHLLDSKAVADLVTILHGMEHERLGAICIARSGSDVVLGALLPFLTETIDLKPLTVRAIREIGKIWGYDLKRLPRLTRFLYERTRGIPLVIQSALNRLLTSRDELARNPVRAVRQIAKDTEKSLTHGLTEGLTDGDIGAARRLATLGETFSVLGAELILDAPEARLERLYRAGVITQSFVETPPLFGFPSERPRFSFTHSLLHERLLSEAPPPDDRTLDLLESDMPLYATTLFVYLANKIGPNFDADRIEHTLERLVIAVEERIDSPNWKAAAVILEAARTVYRLYSKKFSKPKARSIRFDLVRLQLGVLNAFPSHPDFIAAVDELLEMTKDPADETATLQRLTALEYSIYRTDEGWTFRADTVFGETEQLVQRFPGILLHPRYIYLLGQIAGALRSSSSYEAIEHIRTRFDAIMDAAETAGNEEARRAALLEIAPSFISIFRTPEDLADRRQLAEKIAAECGEEMPEGRFVISWPRFLESIGEMRLAKEVLGKWCPHPLSGYDLSREFVMRLLELVVDAALDEDLDRIAQAGFDLLEEFHDIRKVEEKEEDATLAQTAVATHIIVISIMRGEVAWGTKNALRICDNFENINRYMEFERAALTGDVDSLKRLLEQEQIRPAFVPLVRYGIGLAGSSREEAVHAARALLNVPVIQRSNILFVRLVVALGTISMRNPESSLLTELKEDIVNGVNECAQWLAERKIPAYLRPLLHEARPFFEEPDSEEKRDVMMGALEQTEKVEASAVPRKDSDGLVRISMMGTIAFQLPGGKLTKVRGPRPQQLLGMLTANELLAVPISLADFRTHVTGSATPEESANYLRVLVSRVRKQLGPNTILSDGESAPRLNYAVVQTDLIEGTRLIARALSLARNRQADQAYRTLMHGFETLGNGEPYPGLTDEVFTAAREEYRILLHRAVIETATLLKKGKDTERSEQVLRKGIDLLPKDEEIRGMMGKE